MNNKISMLFGASNALTKWLKADFPRLPVEQGKQAGVNSLRSDSAIMCWQAHIIENEFKSRYKTIIVCEANSRFLFLLPVSQQLTREELSERLIVEWQAMLAETLECYRLLPSSDIALLLCQLSELQFDAEWVTNTDLSISGHISDTALWVTETIREHASQHLSTQQAVELAVYLNTQVKRVTNKMNRRKDKFVPVERLLTYCQNLVSPNDLKPEVNDPKSSVKDSNVIYLSDYKRH